MKVRTPQEFFAKARGQLRKELGWLSKEGSPGANGWYSCCSTSESERMSLGGHSSGRDCLNVEFLCECMAAVLLIPRRRYVSYKARLVAKRFGVPVWAVKLRRMIAVDTWAIGGH